MEKELAHQPGRDLVLVRYSDSHDPSSEWVYNKAEIDAAEVVWSREISIEARSELIRYFHNRNVWVVEADAEPAVRKQYVGPEAVPSSIVS